MMVKDRRTGKGSAGPPTPCRSARRRARRSPRANKGLATLGISDAAPRARRPASLPPSSQVAQPFAQPTPPPSPQDVDQHTQARPVRLILDRVALRRPAGQGACVVAGRAGAMTRADPRPVAARPRPPAVTCVRSPARRLCRLPSAHRSLARLKTTALRPPSRKRGRGASLCQPRSTRMPRPPAARTSLGGSSRPPPAARSSKRSASRSASRRLSRSGRTEAVGRHVKL